jgi:glutamine synthetase
MAVNLANWIAEKGIDEVECIVPDINGVQRGKVLPAKKFLASVRDKSLGIIPRILKISGIRTPTRS